MSDPNCFCHESLCRCNVGYQLVQGGGVCEGNSSSVEMMWLVRQGNQNVFLSFLDADECLYDPCGSDQLCVNTAGSYFCTCNVGYVYNLINKTCNGNHFFGSNWLQAVTLCMCIADFDECSFGATDCDENATCINLDGGYDCTCFDGFIGDGRNCYSNGIYDYLCVLNFWF